MISHYFLQSIGLYTRFTFTLAKAFLDWKDRPIKVKDKINECWDKLYTQYSGPVVPRTHKSQPDLLIQIREVPIDTKLRIFIAKDRKQIKATLTAQSTEEPVANRTRSKTKRS